MQRWTFYKHRSLRGRVRSPAGQSSTRLRAYGLGILSLLGLAAAPANAAEIINYTYSPKGQLLSVTTSGGPSSGVQTTYEYDRADNRTSVTTVGATTPSTSILTIQLKGFTVLIPR